MFYCVQNVLALDNWQTIGNQQKQLKLQEILAITPIFISIFTPRLLYNVFRPSSRKQIVAHL